MGGGGAVAIIEEGKARGTSAEMKAILNKQLASGAPGLGDKGE